MLRHFFPIWGGIAVFISLLGLLITQLKQEISAETALYFAWVTGTTMGFSDIVPTVGIIRVLAIIIAIMGIVLTGIVVTIAIEAAKNAVENDISFQEYRQAVRESTQRRVVRERKRGSRRLEEGG